jgi:hypothetical protein
LKFIIKGRRAEHSASHSRPKSAQRNNRNAPETVKHKPELAKQPESDTVRHVSHAQEQLCHAVDTQKRAFCSRTSKIIRFKSYKLNF